jgi:hypothetical protein
MTGKKEDMSMRFMKWVLVVVAVVVLGLVLRGLYANSIGNVVNKLNLAQKDSGALCFSVSYGGFIPLGDAIITNEGIKRYNNRQVYHMHAQAKPAQIVDLFSKIEATADSYVDKDKLHTLMFSHKLEVLGKKKEDKVITYDQRKLFMEKDGEKRTILPDTQDPLSLILYLNNVDIEEGKEFDLNINTNQLNYQVLANAENKLKIKKGDKEIEVFVLKGTVKRRDGSFRNSLDFTIWLMDKPKRAPLLIKVFTKVGPLTARLTDMD